MATPNRSTLIYFLASDMSHSDESSPLPHFSIGHAMAVEKTRKALKDCLPKGMQIGDDLVATSRGLAVEVHFMDGSTDDFLAIESRLVAHAKALFEGAARIAANAEGEAPQPVEEIVANKKELALLSALSACGKEGLRPTVTTAEGQMEYPLPDPGHLNIKTPESLEEALIRGTLTGVRIRANGIYLESEARYWIVTRLELAKAVDYLLRRARVAGKITRRAGSDAWDIYGELDFSPEQKTLDMA